MLKSKRANLIPSRLHAHQTLNFKGLYRVGGTTRLDEQIREVGSTIHVFGHSHINWEKEVDGVLYVQNAKGYPRETWLQPCTWRF